MSALAVAEKAAERLIAEAAKHPGAVEAIGHLIENVFSSANPAETARRGALATASAEASEEALKRLLGRG